MKPLQSGVADDGAHREWSELSDSLVRGLVHSLNNRVAALAAFRELAEMGDDDVDVAQVLPGELARLQEVSRLFRELLTDGTPPEALEVEPVLHDAEALHAHHPRLRSVRCEVVHSTELGPLRVPRWAFLRLLVVLMDIAKQEADVLGADTGAIYLAGTDRTLTVRVSARQSLLKAAAAFAELCAGTASMNGSSLTITLPTLVELRRVERLAREASAG